MGGNSLIMGHVNRRRRGAPINCREPACVAMGQDVDWQTFFAGGGGADEAEPMLAYGLAKSNVFVSDLACESKGRRTALGFRQREKILAHPIESKAQIDCRRAGGSQTRARPFEVCAGGIGPHRERQ